MNIEIEISGGCLTSVNGLPEGWTYTLIDHDNEEENELETFNSEE